METVSYLYPEAIRKSNQEITLHLTGPVTPKARPRHHGNQSYLPGRYRQWKEDAIAELSQQYEGEPIPQAIVTIEILGSARGDLDNISGAVLDALVQAGVLVDDRISCIPRLEICHVPGKIQGAKIQISQL
uniref:Endodeoxyribonuclease RusA n=1 Tax=Cyanothece sp. (strain PCC 7425 / ATCC 29141) TaxID=395961 RepID=B8HN12_CYAP4